jgi:hypothetical protein
MRYSTLYKNKTQRNINKEKLNFRVPMNFSFNNIHVDFWKYFRQNTYVSSKEKCHSLAKQIHIGKQKYV